MFLVDFCNKIVIYSIEILYTEVSYIIDKHLFDYILFISWPPGAIVYLYKLI